MEELMSCKTASQYYSFSEAYFRKLLQNKKINSIKIGYSIRMLKSDLDIHFEEKRNVEQELL